MTGMPFDAGKEDLKIDELVAGKLYISRDAYLGHSVIVVGEDGVARNQCGNEPTNSPYRVLAKTDAIQMSSDLRSRAKGEVELADFIDVNLS